MSEAAVGEHCNYSGCIPIADLFIGTMIAGQERRSQGADYVHEFMRLGSAEDRGKMNQAQAFGYKVAVESPGGIHESRRGSPAPSTTGAVGGGG